MVCRIPSVRRLAIVAEQGIADDASRILQMLAEEKLPDLRIFWDLDPVYEVVSARSDQTQKVAMRWISQKTARLPMA